VSQKMLWVPCLILLLPGCFRSANKESDGADSSELQAEPIWDLGDEIEPWDMDTFEFDGYSPPTCSLFSVDVEWDMNFEETYVSRAFFEASDAPLLSVISLHGATGCPAETRCPVTVHVSRTYRPVVLLLSSHDRIEWIIDRAEGARIERILAFGSYEPMVTGADDVPTDLTDGQFVDYCWPRCAEHETETWVRAIAEDLGIELGSFHGAYEALDLSLWHMCREECLEEVACAGKECGMNECGYECGTCPSGHVCVDHACTACSPDCTGRECGRDGCDGSCGTCPEGFICVDGRCTEAPYFTGCEHVSAESHYCLTINGNGLAVIGLDSGIVCPVGKHGEVISEDMSYAHSIALLDGYLHMCVDDAIGREGFHGVLRYSLLSGLWEVIPVLCHALARYRDGLLVQPIQVPEPSGIVYYQSIDDLREEISLNVGEDIRALHMTVHEQTLYVADGENLITTYLLPSGSETGTLHLESFNAPFQGEAVTDDGLLVCIAALPSALVAVYDASTADHLYDVAPVNTDGEQTVIRGLVCFTNP
jgi:hypothetical protein